MKRNILDLYTDYLISSFGQTTATGLAQLMEGAISHDQVTRMLSSPKMTSKDWWQMVKPQVRKIEREDGLIIVDDSIVEKPYTDENEIICWHYDHSKERTVKGINFVTTLYYAQDVALPVTFEIVSKTVTYIDKKTAKRNAKVNTPRMNAIDGCYKLPARTRSRSNMCSMTCGLRLQRTCAL